MTIQVVGVTSDGLGYDQWLIIKGYGASDVLRYDDGESTRIAHCHPPIPALQIHSDTLGVPVGTRIAGVRWSEPDNQQLTCN